MAQPTVQELQQQLTDLNTKLKAAGGLGIDLQTAFRNAGNDVQKLNQYIDQLNKQYNDLIDNADYIYSTFRDITAELKNQNLLLKIGRSAFKEFTSIAQDLNYYQKGNNDITDKQFKKIKNSIGLEKQELEFAVKKLSTNEQQRRSEVQALNALTNRTSKQNARLKELLKENELLENAKEALNSGIPILEKELNLTKQISRTRQNIGGLAQATGKTISQYGGSLASFLDITEATEAVDEYNKKLIQEALNNKKVQNKLLAIEKEKNNLERAGLLSDKKRVELEDKAYNIKQKAIKNVDNLSNKFKSLGIFVKELGGGLKKALTDPVIILTFIIGKALEANKQTVELGKALGYGEKNAYRFRENIAAIARNSTNINVTAVSLTEAFNELVQATGFAYEFTVDQLETQIKLTKQVGLQADEAAQIQRFSVLTGKSSEETYKSFVRGLTTARNQLRVGINFKATLAEAVKVSGQLAANLGFNPERIAKAIVQAKAFGMTLEQVAKAGEVLLNFESSIENELKAELLTGKQLNLERARAAALAGDQVTLAEELAKNVGTAADFAKMNVLQQRSLAESVGMTTDELAETLRKREEAIRSGKSLAQITEEEAKQALERQAIQDKFNQAILKLQDFFGNLLAGPVGQLLDVITQIVGVITDVLQPVLNTVFAPLVWAAKTLGGMSDILKTMLYTFLAIRGVQLSINGLKKIALGYDIAMRAANQISANLGLAQIGTNRVKVALEKESLLTKIAGNVQLFNQLVTEHGIGKALKIQFGLQQATQTVRRESLLLTMKDWLLEKGKVLLLNLQKVGMIALNTLKTIGSAITKKETIFSIAAAAMNAFKAAVSGIGALLGPLAIPIGIAAAAGVAALGYNLLKGDDIISEGGYGKRTLLAPEGAIRLNDKDTVIAGTNLGGGKGETMIPQIDLTPMITAINEVKAAVDRLYSKDTSINMDGKKVGTTLVQSSYKVA